MYETGAERYGSLHLPFRLIYFRSRVLLASAAFFYFGFLLRTDNGPQQNMMVSIFEKNHPQNARGRQQAGRDGPKKFGRSGTRFQPARLIAGWFHPVLTCGFFWIINVQSAWRLLVAICLLAKLAD